MLVNAHDVPVDIKRGLILPGRGVPIHQLFKSGQPPVVNVNKSLADRVFGQADSEKLMASFRQKTDPGQPNWYNAKVEPNVGTCIFLEVNQADDNLSDQLDSSFDSDELINDFLQDKNPYEVYQHKHEAHQQKQQVPATSLKLKILGTSEECVSLKSRMYDRKPTTAETIFDIKDTPRVQRLREIKKDVTEITKRRRARKQL